MTKLNEIHVNNKRGQKNGKSKPYFGPGKPKQQRDLRQPKKAAKDMTEHDWNRINKAEAKRERRRQSKIS